MDDRRFDDLSKVLGTAFTRQGVYKFLAGLSAAGVSAVTGLELGEAKNKKGKGHAGKHHDSNKGKGDHDNGNGGSHNAAQAEGKGHKGKGKGKHKKKKKQPSSSDNVSTTSDNKLCPGNQDKVCHCPPGNTGNCQTTGNGGGHGDHDPLDCCCTIDGVTNPDCECPDGLDEPCCKPEGTACANDSQCCDNGFCCNIENGIGICHTDECCVPKTCADFPGQCGTFDDGCGGDLNCNCDQGEICCGDECISGDQCCQDSDCAQLVCQNRDCVEHECTYTDVPDGQQGPECTAQGEFCCHEKCCEAGDVCTATGCCTPKTCADFGGRCGTFSDECGNQIQCGCGQGETCCGDVCKANSTFCGQDCNVCGAQQTCCGGVCKDNSSFCGRNCNICEQGETCCGDECVSGNQCCTANNCDDVLCQIAACNDGSCGYTPVDNGDQGPLCTGEGDFCCNGNDCCERGDVCTGQGCCTPKTCVAGQCGDFPDECGGTLHCGCPEGQGCCDRICITGEQCCATEDCAPRICQNRDCVEHECTYTDVPDGQQGPECTAQGEFCCNAEECCEGGDVCLESGCCTPKTCAPGQCGTFDNGCGGTLDCTCGEGQRCCGVTCVGDDECCAADDCDEVVCQVPACDDGTCEYTKVDNGDQGPLCDDTGQFCCNGNDCCEAGDVCIGAGCCTPKTCAADYPGQCGQKDDGCGGTINCTCAEGQGCCNGTCIEGEQCCADSDCTAEVCQTVKCNEHECDYTPVDDGEQGPLCDGEGDFCCNGEDCCEAGDVCTGEGCCTPKTCADFPGQCGPQDDGCGGQTVSCECPQGQPCLEDGTCCVPDTKEQACQGAGRVCGEVADGCGGTYDCGSCSTTQTCIAGVCLASGGKRKRCKGHGLAGQQCKGKKCKCKGGRKCHNGRCCEKVGDGSRHCNADSDCCPGLACRRRQPGQHKVCVKKPVNANSVIPTTTPGLAIGAALTGLLMKGASRLFGASSANAEIAIDDLAHPHGDQQL